MSARLRETKAMNAKNAEILRGLLKLPDNKYCVDCKHNDARWASTNLGIFLCIRCSGIHRGLGVHISRVRSVDLDTWSPEQIANMQRWGNAKANLYWEAHLKEGHQPPEHKIEQFIRSKYESKRWAMEGPIPDPDTLGAPFAATPAQVTSPTTASATSPKIKSPAASKPSAIDLLGGAFGESSSASAPTSNKASPSLAYPSPPSGRTSAPPSAVPTNAQPRMHPTKATSPPPPASQSQGSGNGLFDLDFNAPAAASTNNASAPRKNANDIMSLFGSPSTVSSPPVQNNNNSTGGGLDAFASLNLGGASGWGAPASNTTSYGGNTTQYQQTQNNFGQSAARPASNSISAGNPWAAATAVDNTTSKNAQTSSSFYSPPQANSSSKPPAYNNGLSNDFFSSPATSNNFTSPAKASIATTTTQSSMDFFNSQDIWGAPVSGNSNSKPAAGDAFGGFSSGTTGKNSAGFDDSWN